MKRLERFSTIALIAGVFFFFLGFITLGLWPSLMTHQSDQMSGIPETVPEDFKQYYVDGDAYQKALFLGRDRYVAEGCWHCHSQYVRPVSNESTYYGAVSTPGEYENLLHRPQLFGTRRVGPDLSRQAGKHSNDWHFAHLYDPRSVVPQSVMPSYKWYFDESGDVPVPKEEAVALVAYLQWLGSWITEAPRHAHELNEILMPPEPTE